MALEVLNTRRSEGVEGVKTSQRKTRFDGADFREPWVFGLLGEALQ